jgi:hypothetical protein
MKVAPGSLYSYGPRAAPCLGIARPHLRLHATGLGASSFGTPPTVAETEECRRSAYIEAQHRAFFYSFARPHFYRDRRGRRIYDP